jgi:hypothetical protein
MRAEELHAAPEVSGGGNATFERLVERGLSRSAVLRLDGGAQLLVALDRGDGTRTAETPGARWRIAALPGAALLWARG